MKKLINISGVEDSKKIGWQIRDIKETWKEIAEEMSGQKIEFSYHLTPLLKRYEEERYE